MPDLFENDWSKKAIGLKNTFFFSILFRAEVSKLHGW